MEYYKILYIIVNIIFYNKQYASQAPGYFPPFSPSPTEP